MKRSVDNRSNIHDWLTVGLVSVDEVIAKLRGFRLGRGVMALVSDDWLDTTRLRKECESNTIVRLRNIFPLAILWAHSWWQQTLEENLRETIVCGIFNSKSSAEHRVSGVTPV